MDYAEQVRCLMADVPPNSFPNRQTSGKQDKHCASTGDCAVSGTHAPCVAQFVCIQEPEGGPL